jgi:hypothetical protein
MPLEQRDERQEKAAIQAVLVKIVGFDIRCCDHNHAAFE